MLGVQFSFCYTVDVDLVKGTADITVDGQGITGVPLDYMTKDIGSIRFYLYGSELTDSFFIDNLQVKARFNSQFITTPPNENNEYVIDFESPPIDTGQSGLGVYPYKENNFDITYVLRRDPNNIPTNGTVNAGLTFNSRPILYHKYGYAFALHSIDIADYSAIVGLMGDFIIKGYKQNGDILSYTISPSQISLNFKTFEFGSEWGNLNYVIFDGDSITMDNIVLTVTDKKVQFLPAKLN
jgi:hypothetical protein